MTEASASGPAEDHVLMLSKEQVVMRKDPPQSSFLSLLPPPVFRKEDSGLYPDAEENRASC